MPPIKAVLFDLDDTLWPIVPVIMRAERLLFDWLREHAPAVAASYSIEEMRARRVALMKAEPRYAINLAALRHAVLSEVFVACGENAASVDTAMDIFNTARNGMLDVNGTQKMPGYRHAIDERDAWAIVAYVRTLQEAHSGSLADVPEGERAVIERQRDAALVELRAKAAADAEAKAKAPPAPNAPAPTTPGGKQ